MLLVKKKKMFLFPFGVGKKKDSLFFFFSFQSNVIMYHLLHAGMAREPPLPLRHGSWPLQRHTSILHITNVSFASASVCPPCVIALKCVSHTLASCVTEVVLWFGTWNCMPPTPPPLFSFQHLGSPLKWHCISTVVGQPPCHCCVCHFLRFFVVNAFSLHLNFSLFVSVCLVLHCLFSVHVFVVFVHLHPSVTSGISFLLWIPPERGLGMVTCFLPHHS